jgi:hypothetical protein
MEIFIKVAPRHYDLLRSRIPGASPAHKALAKATPIEHSVGGVEFEGYSIPCDGDQARVILAVARQCCPEITRDIEKAIRLGRTDHENAS